MVGTLIDATLSLPGKTEPLSLVGRVVQTEPKGLKDEVESAISIIEMGLADRRALSEYLKTL